MPPPLGVLGVASGAGWPPSQGQKAQPTVNRGGRRNHTLLIQGAILVRVWHVHEQRFEGGPGEGPGG